MLIRCKHSVKKENGDTCVVFPYDCVRAIFLNLYTVSLRRNFPLRRGDWGKPWKGRRREFWPIDRHDGYEVSCRFCDELYIYTAILSLMGIPLLMSWVFNYQARNCLLHEVIMYWDQEYYCLSWPKQIHTFHSIA